MKSGILQLIRNITCLVLNCAITFTEIRTLFKPPSQNWDPKPVNPPALIKKHVDYLLVIERKYLGYTRDDVRKLAL